MKTSCPIDIDYNNLLKKIVPRLQGVRWNKFILYIRNLFKHIDTHLLGGMLFYVFIFY